MGRRLSNQARMNVIRDCLERDGPWCMLCGHPFFKLPEWRTTVDHIIPIARGGAHYIENMQAAHLFCNQLKANQLEGEYDAEEMVKKAEDALARATEELGYIPLEGFLRQRQNFTFQQSRARMHTRLRRWGLEAFRRRLTIKSGEINGADCHPSGGKKLSKEQASERNWNILRLRGIYSQIPVGILPGDVSLKVRASIDDALIALGAEPECTHRARIREALLLGTELPKVRGFRGFKRT